MQEFRDTEENIEELKNLINDDLPEENEIIISADGLIVLDEESEFSDINLGIVIDSVLCGC